MRGPAGGFTRERFIGRRHAKASEATAHPAFDLGEAYAKDKKKRVCYSKSDGGHVVITSQGPGTAIEFALALVKELCG